ncbi:MAG: hypothetical protein CL793_07420 [Chloroflexi bacterium]|nr:hypothetical protein [Chloroflexota bacterium]
MESQSDSKMRRIGITAGWALDILEVKLEEKGEHEIDWMTKSDGTRPTATEAIEYLKTLDPEKVINRD